MPPKVSSIDMSQFCAVMDTHGLKSIAASKNALAMRMIKSGCLRVPTAVWKEYRELFEEEANEFQKNSIRIIQQKPSHLIGAGRIPNSSRGGLALRAYGNPDWLAGGVAIAEQKRLFTTEDRVQSYLVPGGAGVFRIQDISECVLCSL